MVEKEETQSGEQDDVSFLRTGDIVALTCVSSNTKDGAMGSERVCLSTEGFANRMCVLENVSDKDIPPDISQCMLYIDNALSVRALQEMMSAENDVKGTSGSGGHKTLLYGHAVQLKHVQSEMYLACINSCSSSDKLSFDVGVQESNEGETSWWTIHPASKQRSEGEKVRVGDDVILVSVATERYLHMALGKNDQYIVIASFHQTLWNIASVSSGSIRNRNMGVLFGNDVLRLFHGNDECLTIPENWSENQVHNVVIYEGGNAVSQARSLWRVELIRMKWHGAMIGYDQTFRIRHITTGRYLGVLDNAVILLQKDKADFETTAFVMCPNKDPKKTMLEEKEEEGMGVATIRYGETDTFIQHHKTQLWLSYQTTEVTKKGLGKVEEKKAVALKDGHMDDCYTFFMALEEESKSARVIRKCSSVLNRFLKGVEALQNEGNQAYEWKRVNLNSVLTLMEDLIEYFAQPTEEHTFEERQVRFRALRSRQDLFQEEGVLNMILDTIDKFSQMEALPDFNGLIGDKNQAIWEEISTYLYLLVAAMIKGNHSNCAQFAAAQRLDWLFGRLSNPQSAEGILDVLYCVLTESPEALNMINEGHIKSVISLLEKVGRDPKVLDVLSSLCEGNGMAVRSSQNTIADHLLPGKDLLLQSVMRDHVSSVMPNILVGVVEGSSLYRKWYFETEVEHIEETTKSQPVLRIGWANTSGFKPYPGSGNGWGCNGCGDDFFSYGYDGKFMWFSGKARSCGNRVFKKGDVIGCSLNLTIPEIRFYLNGIPIQTVFRNFNFDGFFFPVMSLSSKVSCRFLFGGDHGKLKYGPPEGFSPIFEAVDKKLEIVEVMSFGDLTKNIYSGTSNILNNIEPFVPEPVDISKITLSSFALQHHTQFAQNLHELWAMKKISLGWTYSQSRSETLKTHPCLISFDQLPATEKEYNLKLSLDTMRTIEALGYHMILDKPPTRMRPIRLPNNFLMSNGYKPQPLDTHEIVLSESIETTLVEALAKNIHNVWAKEKIKRGYTFGVHEIVTTTQKRSPHLVPYENVDLRIKEANKETARETIKVLQLFGIFLESPAIEHDEQAEKEFTAKKASSITYRAETSYAVTNGKWYFEFEVLTNGFMRVGWADISCHPDTKVGSDDKSYAFDGYLGKKWHQGAESYGKEWKIGDIVGCFLDLNDRTISFSLNGELLLDPSGSEMAFDNIINGDGFVPCMTLSAGQKAKLNFGQDSNSLKFFTTCGLQEGYEPFCVNMYRQMPMWYGKNLPMFREISHVDSSLEMSRILPTSNTPPCLKLTLKAVNNDGSSSDKVNQMEFIRLSLPVKVNSSLIYNDEKERTIEAMKEYQYIHMNEHDTDSEKDGKKKKKGLLSAFGRKNRRDSDDDTHGGKLTIHSSIGEFDMSEGAAAHTRSECGDSHSDSQHDKISTKSKEKKPGIFKRLRDASHTRQKEKLSAPEPKKYRTTEILPSTVVSMTKRGSNVFTDSNQGSIDVLADMPVSGPGRKSFKRKGSKNAANTKTLQTRGSVISTTLGFEDPLIGEKDSDASAMKTLGENINDYYFGLRIFPGQDPSSVYVGWVTPQYHSYVSSFKNSQAVRSCKFSELEYSSSGLSMPMESIEFRNCYLLNAGELLTCVNDTTNTKVTGVLIGCVIDTSAGELSFYVEGQDTGRKFRLEAGLMLYPAAFVIPTSSEVCQFELGRVKYTWPLSAALFKSSAKSLIPYCPPRLGVQVLTPYHWARVPNECLRTTALKLSDIRGWSVLCNDPIRVMLIHIPEKNKSYDILELIEMPELLTFHRQTLNLYCKLASHGNQKVSHILCQHVDEDQIMYAIKNHYLSGSMRQGFHDFLIACHLKSHTDAILSTSHEYVLPLVSELTYKDVFSDDSDCRYPHILGQSLCIRPIIKSDPPVKCFTKDSQVKLLPPSFNFNSLKNYVMSAFGEAMHHAVMNCRDLIGGNNSDHFEPLFKLFDHLLIMGLFNDDELIEILKILHPAAFDENYKPGTKLKGILDIDIAEGVKLQIVNILDHLCDIQLRNRIESLIAFSEGFVGDLQQDQCARYMDIKQTDMPPAEAARKTKEFRCPPNEQMYRLLSCKKKEDKEGMMLDDDVEYDQCPMADSLQEQLRDFCSLLVNKCGCNDVEEDVSKIEEIIDMDEETSWVDSLAHLVVSVPPSAINDEEIVAKQGSKNFRNMIVQLLKQWATDNTIESNELIRRMFALLLRQYNGIRELMDAMNKTYVFHDRNIEDVQNFITFLMQIRELLTVQFEITEEVILKRALWQLMNNRIFFQHPDLMRLLKVHENVMTIMMNVLTAQQNTVEIEKDPDDPNSGGLIKDASEMVVACSRFLCYFCRTSRQNQKAMFEHLSFLLDNATMLLARPSLRGSVPLDVAYSSFMDNNELALALKEEELDKVTVYLSRCGLQPNSELITKEYPDIGWDPLEGERYIDFLRFCVWINGENVEENANLVIRLLIRRPECLGVALKGEGQGLFSAFQEAIALSEDINELENGVSVEYLRSPIFKDHPHYPSKETEGDDYVDLGASILDFYSSLVDLLAKCAPDPMTLQEGKGDSVRARAILRSLISLDDLGKILALRFKIPNLRSVLDDNAGPQPGLMPSHKASVLLFLDRVYGIDSQEMLFSFMEQSFLPDLRAATMMDSPKATESDTALALNRYLCNCVLPLLTNHSHFFADAEHHSALLDATLHTVYRMNRLQSLTKNQRDAVSDFLVAITRELPPAMMIKLLRKVIIDIQEMKDNVLVPLRIMTLHYERCNKYYGSGNQYGVANETEKRLSMLLFYAIFDSLGSKPYDPELFGKALPCLTAIGSAISPDYSLTSGSEDTELAKVKEDEGTWSPKPIPIDNIVLKNELNDMINKFAEHFHDSWSARKLEKGWKFAELYSRAEKTHPRLKPFKLLKDYEKSFYKDRCGECIKSLLAWGYIIEVYDFDAAEKSAQNHVSSGTCIQDFNPKPVDLSNMNLEKDMMSAAEKIAENSHNIWCKKIFTEISGKPSSLPPSLVPWDLLTDFERRKNRFHAAEILKFLQYHGYRVNMNKLETPTKDRIKNEGERGNVEKRFAYNLLEKLIQYLEQASYKMKSVKPSQELTRRNSFKKEGQDVKFFEKVVLPMMHAYFNAHKNYFLESSIMVQTGTASNKEKEMVASLFCRLAALLRIKNHAFGSVAKITVKCLQGLTQALDLRTLVKINSDIIRTGLYTFFNNCADDLLAAVNELKNGGQYSLLRGQNLKSWISLEFANQMIIPCLTTMFHHLSRHHFGADLLLDDIQAACYKILDSLYMVTEIQSSYESRATILHEVEKHRPSLGQCLSAFASTFPVAFLEPEFNQNNKYSVLAKSADQSVQVQEMLQNLSSHIPTLENLMVRIEQTAQNCIPYNQASNVYDVDLPLACAYLTFWWNMGDDKSNNSQNSLPITRANSEYMNRIFCSLLAMIKDHIGCENAQWLCRVTYFAVPIIQHVTCDPVKEYLLPIAEKLCTAAELSYKEEERMRTHPDDADEGTVAEDNAKLVRDVYAFFPILMKYTDLHRAKWLKNPSWESDRIYENVAVIFKIWSFSQVFKREELNYMAQFEEDQMNTGGEMKTGKAAIAERKKKRREGFVKKDKHANSIVIACLKRLLPVGLNVFGGRELDIVQQSKEKFLNKENEEKIREFIRGLSEIPVKTDPTDKNAWQLSLYTKIGKSQMRGKDLMNQDAVVEKIANMGQVVAILHTATSRQEKEDKWKKVLTLQRKRMAISLITASHLYKVDKHRGINFFLPAFSKLWLEEEDIGQDKLVQDLCADCEEVESSAVARLFDDDGVLIGDENAEIVTNIAPDPLSQLIQCFQRAATTEESQALIIASDDLYVNFAQVMAKSIHIEEEDDDGGDDDGEVDQAQKEEMAQTLRAEQAVLADRGAAIMCLMYISASNGEPSEMVAKTLKLGIHLLSGGNTVIQKMLIDYLQLKKDVRFFTSIAGLMNNCSVLNLEMFERQIKAEGLGMGAELAAGENQNLNDAEFTCDLFRFLQLTCEGHNLDFQNYLRTQPGHTTSVNLINCIVDYLLRLQESVMDFYWHYSSKEMIDEGGKEYFLRAIQVCSQVFNTLTESIQGPCVGNQMTLANSRLWDAINGFFFLFAHMMEKLYKNSTQLELLREFLNLQKDMIVLMLSMLEGNVLNGAIGKQMVDALVESQQCVEMILKFSDMFLKLKDLTTSQAFQDFDTNKDGWISPKEFQKAMESQKMYSVEEITYLMMCTDVNNDGKVDYMEFTERFHNPARDIGFNLAVLLTNLKEHITSDPRLEKIIEKASTLLEYFDPYLGRIEIMGSSKRVEKIYFEIQESWLEQWSKQQIRDSKNAFLFNVLQDDGGDQGKLEAFINFCEDTIFEMQHAAEISSGDGSDSKMERALKQRDYFLRQTTAGTELTKTMKAGYSMGVNAAAALKPENLQKSFHHVSGKVHSMTWFQLIFTILQFCYFFIKEGVIISYTVIATIFRFLYYMTLSSKEEEIQKPHEIKQERRTHLQKQNMFTKDLPDFKYDMHHEYDAFGIHIPHEDHIDTNKKFPDGTPPPDPAPSVQIPTDETLHVPENKSTPSQSTHYFSPPSPCNVNETHSNVGSVNYLPSISQPEQGPIMSNYEPKIAEIAAARSRGSILNMLARNFKTIEKMTLYLAFFINVILLFHRVDITAQSEETVDEIEISEPVDDDENENTNEFIYITGLSVPYISYEITGWVLSQVLYWLSVFHAFCSFALLISFYQLKIPLITFKREKEVARKLMFDGCWITEDSTEEQGLMDTITWYLDRIVIVSKSFPMKYWDKFVRRKTKAKYKDQVDEETLNKLLGEERAPGDTSFDYRYNCWLWFGVILTNAQFLYRVGYLICSTCGVVISPFFYAFHLIDVVLSFPMLKAILQSVTHNLQQLILTIMMTLVVVYLYTVLAFNFFRKFYVQEGEEGEEPDRKCHNMLTCFIYHFYAGVRAGGGIADEIESPYGDELEYPRMLYDISFFFFVIVILLAIMQGLIIDAFGELRDQQEAATEKLESSCFICDIGKETFDRVPRGFEIHTTKEHNFANYLFFLQHLVNKDETEYTGQETYVREKYDNRDWEFFPVGECFMKQYEDQLLQP